MTLDPPPIIHDIVSQHAEEAAFLWLLRDIAVGEPHYSLSDLGELDDRVDAHLDGLRIAGDPGWEIVRNELTSWEEQGEVFAAMWMALDTDAPSRIEEVLSVVGGASELRRSAVSALGWRPWSTVERLVGGFVRSEDPMLKVIGLRATGVHRRDPGAALSAALRHEELDVRCAAARTAGETGRHEFAADCMALCQEDDPDSVFVGARSAALLGHDGAARQLFQLATDAGARGPVAADLLARLIDPERTLGWFSTLSRESPGRLACVVARACGRIETIPWLLDAMAEPDLARPAGEAFATLTGVDLAYDDLERDAPEDFEAGPSEDPDDQDVEMDMDEDLPWPDPALVAGWWHDNSDRFQSGVRYLAGHVLTSDSAHEVLRSGMQRERHAAALEIALSSPNMPLFETRASGLQQKRTLGL